MRLARARGSDVFTNVVARGAALAALALTTLIVARVDGPAAVGDYALMRVLPGLAGVLLSAGLPGAVAYFLAGGTSADSRLRPTVVAIAVAGGGLGTVLWVAGTPVLGAVFFQNLDPSIVACAGLTVLTQLLVATAKGCSQGGGDLPGANRIIVLEELMFLPTYLLLVLAGASGYAAIIGGLVGADAVTAVLGWSRLARRGFFRGKRSPSIALARRVCSYGARAQIGGVLSLLNLRLDFVLLGALAGPVVLGTYAIASKFAELLRLLPLALTYVLYPKFAAQDATEAAARARALMPKTGLLTAAAAVPLAFAAALLPMVYGEAFRAAVVPTYILLFGLAGEGLSSVGTAFLYGAGRPGLNSLGIGAGVVVTVVLDLALIPRFGAVGAALASSAAYLTTTLVLLVCFWMLSRSLPAQHPRPVVVGSQP